MGLVWLERGLLDAYMTVKGLVAHMVARRALGQPGFILMPRWAQMLSSPLEGHPFGEMKMDPGSALHPTGL